MSASKARAIQRAFKVSSECREAVHGAVTGWKGEVVARSDNHCDWSYTLIAPGERLIVRQYRSGTLQLQGKGAHQADGLERAIADILGQSDTDVPVPHCGSDEAGKGDYFGPLVVAGVLVDAGAIEALRAMAVGDSKGLTDARVLALAKAIPPVVVNSACISLLPTTYNDLYARMRAEGKNLNDLLAWAHAKVLRELESGAIANAMPEVALVDKFASDRLLLARMRESSMRLVQIERAERYPAVAAASILARGRFLRDMGDLSKKVDLSLPKGGGALVDQAARDLVERKGVRVLGTVAKIHFSNTDRVLEEGP